MGDTNYNNNKTHSRGNPDVVPYSLKPALKMHEIMGIDSMTCENMPWTTTVPVTGLTRINGNLHIAGNNYHEGILWVKGDLKTVGGNDFKGLILVEGDYDAGGNFWMLGGITIRGTTKITAITGTFDILYSSEAIARAIQRATGAGLTMWTQREFVD